MIISNYLKIKRLIHNLISLLMATYRLDVLSLADDNHHDQEKSTFPKFPYG